MLAKLAGRGGQYELEIVGRPSIDCVVKGTGRLVVRRGYYQREIFVLHPTATESGQITAFSGTKRIIYEVTSQAARRDCPPEHEFFPLQGRLIG